jgi:hypothetical protein
LKVKEKVKSVQSAVSFEGYITNLEH